MAKQNNKRTKRVRNLVFICALTAIVLTVSTYAWFIGMQSVNVSSFDIEIKSADSLLLSLDGETWSSTISVTKDTLNTKSYEGHTNSWGGVGIFPVSSIGEMDSDASRMKLFEKASLTPTTGGYRLLASRIENYTGDDPERDGYVVFDLFIRNYTRTKYIPDLEPLDEEAIYLTTDSKVTVASTGVKNTGIENSARVAFAQIGRVSGEIIAQDEAGTIDAPDIITGITCADDDTNGVTGICRTAQIWEPNDKLHVASAIGWYDTSCLTRTGSLVTQVASYGSTVCGTVASGTAYETYAVNNNILSSNNVDIYDGRDYNSYTASTTIGSCTEGTVPTTEEKCLSSYGSWDDGACTGSNKAYCDAINGTYTETKGLLEAYPYFTDTMKMLTGTNRPAFMTLAPNSITKIRVYVYIEGQDIDNYDFASIGKTIAVEFGFTKERFTSTDIGYTGPSLTDEEEEEETPTEPVVEENPSAEEPGGA